MRYEVLTSSECNASQAEVQRAEGCPWGKHRLRSAQRPNLPAWLQPTTESILSPDAGSLKQPMLGHSSSWVTQAPDAGSLKPMLGCSSSRCWVTQAAFLAS